MKQMQKSKGFTLIEIMVVVGIIGILSAIAIPAYRDYVIRGKLPEAYATMADARVKMELFFQDNPGTGYGNTGGAGTDACSETTVARYVAGNGLKYFTFACRVTGANTYVLTATGKTSEGLGNLVYTVDEQNQQRTTSVPTGWSGAGATCWVRKKDGSC